MAKESSGVFEKDAPSCRKKYRTECVSAKSKIFCNRKKCPFRTRNSEKCSPRRLIRFQVAFLRGLLCSSERPFQDGQRKSKTVSASLSLPPSARFPLSLARSLPAPTIQSFCKRRERRIYDRRKKRRPSFLPSLSRLEINDLSVWPDGGRGFAKTWLSRLGPQTTNCRY